MPEDETRRVIDAVWKMESARLIGGLVRMTRDVARAEELAQEALVAALERWPESGIPDKPGAWLMATAKHRALDQFRRDRVWQRKQGELERAAAEQQNTIQDAVEAGLDDWDDDVLRLMFMACHPVLRPEGRVALTLRLLGGLTTAEISRAFLVPEATVAQRIVRAKRTLAEKRVTLEAPARNELAERAGSVLGVIYLIFNEGYAATAGGDWMRPALCQEAMRLGRMLAQLMPDAAEAHGLVALMELQASRLAARTGPDGEPVLLADQDRTRWDGALIRHGLDALRRAENGAPTAGVYTLQAQIAACHATARTAADTDWQKIAQLYDLLAQAAPSPVVELNRAVAVSMARGAQAGLDLVDTLTAEPAFAAYHLLPSVRGHLLSQLERHSEARAEFERAAALTGNARERELLNKRARAALEAERAQQ